MFKTSRILVALVSAVSSLAFGPALRPQTPSTDSFDRPLKKKVVDVGPSPYYHGVNVRVRLSCFSYPTFLVKEYDEGQKGAEWLAITPVSKNSTPECAKSHAPGEKVIVYPEWSGYFKGAKGNLVFFYASDGENGGMPFVVYDSKAGIKVFEDSTYDSKWLLAKINASPFDTPRFRVAQDGRVFLQYLRVVEAECDLHSHREKAACWEGVGKKLDLKSAHAPVCSRYKDIPTRFDSVIAYPVEVLFFPQPAVKTIPGPVRCWPVD